MPLGVKLRDSNDTFQGCVESHEMPDSQFPLLLPQAAQAHMVFIKEMRKGTTILDDTEEHLLVEAVPQKGHCS